MDPEALAATVSERDLFIDSLRWDDEAVVLNAYEVGVLINALAFAAVERPGNSSRRVEAGAMRKLLRAQAVLNEVALKRIDGDDT